VGKETYMHGMRRLLVQWHVGQKKDCAVPFPQPSELLHCPVVEVAPPVPEELGEYYALLDGLPAGKPGSGRQRLQWTSLQALVWVLDPATLWHKVGACAVWLCVCSWHGCCPLPHSERLPNAAACSTPVAFAAGGVRAAAEHTPMRTRETHARTAGRPDGRPANH
jgi:hypothetical protein